MQIDQNQISIRDLRASDVKDITNYWFNSPEGFIENMGVDFSKLPSKTEMEKTLFDRLKENENLTPSKLRTLIIIMNEIPIGFHTIFPLVESDYGVFHAHIWNSAFRAKGIGFHSYPKACRIFFERFNLRKIIFKTPIQNTGALKVKEKLGIRRIGSEIIGTGIVKEGTTATIFELTKDELLQKFK